MGTKDIAEKHLEEYNDVFADIINVLLFNGKATIKESDFNIKKHPFPDVHIPERDVFYA